MSSDSWKKQGRREEEWGGGLRGGAGRPCAATVTCHAWHSGGRAAGGRRKHHLPGTVGVRAGRAEWLQSWRLSSGFIRREKMKRGEMDLSLTIRLLARPVYVPKSEKRMSSLNVPLYAQYACI